MRQRLCAQCGRIYLSDQVDSRLCPECAQRSRRSVTCKRTCAACGIVFDGYLRSKYCPSCAAEIKRERDRQYHRKGPARPIGSVGSCARCGQEYTVKSARQRYCPECADEAVRENIRQHKQAQRAEEGDRLNARRRELRADRRRVCVVCGKAFISKLPTITCSPECAAEHKRQRQRAYDAKRKPRRDP